MLAWAICALMVLVDGVAGHREDALAYVLVRMCVLREGQMTKHKCHLTYDIVVPFKSRVELMVAMALMNRMVDEEVVGISGAIKHLSAH